jgi:GntR family transcriptional regulator
MSDAFFLSDSDSTPMYGQIMAQVIAKVMAGDWLPGQALPSIRELASASKVSVITVKRAYLELEHAGVIVTRHGKGSYVAETLEFTKQLAREEFQLHLNKLLAAAAKLGMPSAEILREVQAALRGPSAARSPHPIAAKSESQ